MALVPVSSTKPASSETLASVSESSLESSIETLPTSALSTPSESSAASTAASSEITLTSASLVLPPVPTGTLPGSPSTNSLPPVSGATTQPSSIPKVKKRSQPKGCNPGGKDYCKGTNYNAALKDEYVCGDQRLGPIHLPTNIALSAPSAPYDRFGGLCPGEFLAEWFDKASSTWKYPLHYGFTPDAGDRPVYGNTTIPAGVLVDSIGSDYGDYVFPWNTPYALRALPPNFLETSSSDERFPLTYSLYRVLQNFTVLAGPSEPWFGQPGQGIRYKLIGNATAEDLDKGGFLTKVDP
ncbi:hypothetical protein GQ53DRAFT_700791, partial [Thozetella sp. PMI_491]